MLIDEIQYAPELLPHIKMAVDERRCSGMFWLTGSQPFHLMRGVSESLAGRVAVVQLLAASSVHFGNGWGFSNPNGGWEYPVFLAVAALVVALLGDGALALKPAKTD